MVNAVTGNSFDIPGEITSILVRISMGEGFILMILLAAAAGVLCLLAGLTRKARKTTAGLTSGDEEEW